MKNSQGSKISVDNWDDVPEIKEARDKVHRAQLKIRLKQRAPTLDDWFDLVHAEDRLRKLLGQDPL